MSSVRFYNQTAPFWDFVANLEEQATHREAAAEASDDTSNNERPNPWTEGWTGFPWGPFPHRARHGPPHGHGHGHGHGHHHGPPPHHQGPPPPPPAEGEEGEAGPSEPRGPPPPFSDSENEGGHRHGRHAHGHRGPGARGGHCGRGRGGPRGMDGRHGPKGFGGRGPSHPYGRFGPFGPLAEMFQNQLFNNNNDNENETEGESKSEDFKPEVDVFDTTESFVIHASLPGAKKEDVGVNWDADKSELSIAGVIYRPGDEDFLKTLAMDERKVGAFERKVRLGSRASPAQVDIDCITAKLEDGVLRVDVPKLDAEYVQIKKVDIE